MLSMGFQKNVRNLNSVNKSWMLYISLYFMLKLHIIVVKAWLGLGTNSWLKFNQGHLYVH